MISYLKKIKDGLFCSLSGLKFALSEKPFQMEIAVSLVCLPIIMLINKSPAEKAILFFSLFLVLITELINSAIERTLDRISTQQHNLTKQAKDIASCAVFFSVINFIIVCGVIFLS